MSPKINDEFARKAKRAIQVSIIEMGGGEGGEGRASLNFSFDLPKIVAPTVEHAH